MQLESIFITIPNKGKKDIPHNFYLFFLRPMKMTIFAPKFNTLPANAGSLKNHNYEF